MKRTMPRAAFLLGLWLALPAPAEEAANTVPKPSTPDKPAQKNDAANRRPAFPIAAEIADPTRISESFRQALERRMPVKSLPGGEGAKSAPVVAKLPEIALAASVCGRGEDSMQAMLRINGKVELVRSGDKLTLVDKNGLIAIEVLEIQRRHVRVRVMSAGLNEELMLH